MNNKNSRIAYINVHGKFAAILVQEGDQYVLKYNPSYAGPPISLTLPVIETAYTFHTFPAFFEGLLPEGPQLEALLKRGKLDRHDYLGQLIKIGQDLVGAVTVLEGTRDE